MFDDPRFVETLPETNGCFRLNVELPIAFDDWSRMDVDLLCDEARVVVELEKVQSLADATVRHRLADPLFCAWLSHAGMAHKLAVHRESALGCGFTATV